MKLNICSRWPSRTMRVAALAFAASLTFTHFTDPSRYRGERAGS